MEGNVRFCVDGMVPARTVRWYPNNKPWVTKDIKAILNQKKRAFRGGNREELRDIQAPSRRQRFFSKPHTYCIVLADRPYGS